MSMNGDENLFEVLHGGLKIEASNPINCFSSGIYWVYLVWFNPINCFCLIGTGRRCLLLYIGHGVVVLIVYVVKVLGA